MIHSSRPDPGLSDNGWSSLAPRIAGGDPDALGELYRLLKKHLRPRLTCRCPEADPEDILHETLTQIAERIQNGELRNARALQAYSLTVLRRVITSHVMRAMWRRKRLVDVETLYMQPTTAEMSPETTLLERERGEIVVQGLEQLRERDYELLKRFYVQGQSHPQICEEMNLTQTQFRLYKSRAKAKLTAWARQQSNGAPASGSNS